MEEGEHGGLTVAEAAKRSRLSAEAIRRALRDQRLIGERVAGRWQIDDHDFVRFLKDLDRWPGGATVSWHQPLADPAGATASAIEWVNDLRSPLAEIVPEHRAGEGPASRVYVTRTPQIQFLLDLAPAIFGLPQTASRSVRLEAWLRKAFGDWQAEAERERRIQGYREIARLEGRTEMLRAHTAQAIEHGLL